MEFVTACRAEGIQPGLYIAAGCDAYHHCGPEGPVSAAEYQRIQTGMVEARVCEDTAFTAPFLALGCSGPQVMGICKK
jgi:hypothetical protein